MLLFGELNCLPIVNSNTVLFNLSNAREVGIRLSKLIPPLYLMQEVVNYNDSRSFDMFYANHIFSNNEVFMEFMSIMLHLYNGSTVLILIEHGEYRDSITESLIKLIQQRYGYDAYMINEPEDLEYLEESSFSVQGLYNLDLDKERFCSLLPEEVLEALLEEQQSYD